MTANLHRFIPRFLPDAPADGGALLSRKAPQPDSGTPVPTGSGHHAGGEVMAWLRHHHLAPANDEGVTDPRLEAQRAQRFERAAGHRYY
ncbi:MAG: hypothetical protein ABI886_10535 [Betaproteobacteria bacterium]